MSAPALLVAGSLTIDNVRTAEGTLLPRRPGGNVIFAALGARLWSDSIGVVARAGEDYPTEALERLAARNIDLGGVTPVHAPHGMNVAFNYATDGRRVRIFSAEVLATMPAAERARFADYTAAGLASRFAVWEAFSPDASDLPASWAGKIEAAHLACMPIRSHLSLAPALRSARVQVDSPWYDERTMHVPLHRELFADIALLMPSEADLSLWRPADPPLDTAAALARENRKPVLIKQGAAGAALIAPNGGQTRWPALPVAVQDLTGAGDAFCGGFLAGLQATGDPAEAGARGTVSASFAVGGIGTDALLDPDPAEADRRLRWVRDRTTIIGAPQA